MSAVVGLAAGLLLIAAAAIAWTVAGLYGALLLLRVAWRAIQPRPRVAGPDPVDQHYASLPDIRRHDAHDTREEAHP